MVRSWVKSRAGVKARDRTWVRIRRWVKVMAGIKSRDRAMVRFRV
jgi:hypothetical protein